MDSIKKRYGFVGILVDDREKLSAQIQPILSDYGDIILGRMGLPRLEEDISIITLIVHATSDQVGALTGRLGSISGVSVKSGLTK